MYPASQAYKATMKEKWRNEHNYIRATIGIVNQEAQTSAFIPHPESCTYYSNLKKPFDNYAADELYVSCDQNYTTVDESMYFLPRSKWDVVLNQGIVSEGLRGIIEIRFPVPYDIKGLTVEFGKAYPVDFAIESDNHIVYVTGNSSDHYVTEDIFTETTFLRFIPATMVNGEGRLRIHQITMGIGIYFGNREIKSADKTEFVSPITEELPTIDFDMTIDNKGRVYDIENEESTINFLEIGQEIEIVYGQELEDGTIEWMPGAVVRLKKWSADDEVMSFTATDRIADLDGMYYRGEFKAAGTSLYDLAVDVLADANVDHRTYWLYEYLKTVIVNNPVPAVTHKEALQLIANAG